MGDTIVRGFIYLIGIAISYLVYGIFWVVGRIIGLPIKWTLNMFNDSQLKKNGIDRKYNVLIKKLSCPSCNQRYGYEGTLVDRYSRKCSNCVDRTANIDLMDADDFIQNVLTYYVIRS